ncbi:hypothetical protein [Castellaniella sp.]|uniref:hypothetical protein n=1 Tax=Castellaniella sp. TaxID=1955812 RepID=UPI002AFFA09E|nr:hypothetical protein [Castellaniella sp.]
MTATRLVSVQQLPLAFGLDWLPVLGDPALACAQARREGASHLVLSGNPPAALGLAYGLLRAQACWSAADLLAREYPQGTWACMLLLDGQTWHVLACHEGVVLVRADRSYPQPELARQAIEDLRLAYPRLQLLDPHASADDLLQRLARRAAVAPALQGIRPVRTYRMLLAGGLLSLLWWGYAYGLPQSSARSTPDAAQAWQHVLNQSLSRHPLHGETGTRALLQAMYLQPVRLAGWVLKDLQCQPGSVATVWQCRSEYRRLDLQADNRGLLQAAPPGWRLDFPSLDQAQANWSMALDGQIADPQALPQARLVARDWASALQAVLPAFTALRVQGPKPLAVPPPRDADGQALPMPPDFPRLATRAVKVEGPLRSAGLLVPLSRAVSWHKAVVTHAPGTRPGLKSSRLVLHLEGALYENR